MAVLGDALAVYIFLRVLRSRRYLCCYDIEAPSRDSVSRTGFHEPWRVNDLEMILIDLTVRFRRLLGDELDISVEWMRRVESAKEAINGSTKG